MRYTWWAPDDSRIGFLFLSAENTQVFTFDKQPYIFITNLKHSPSMLSVSLRTIKFCLEGETKHFSSLTIPKWKRTKNNWTSISNIPIHFHSSSASVMWQWHLQSFWSIFSKISIPKSPKWAPLWELSKQILLILTSTVPLQPLLNSEHSLSCRKREVFEMQV